MLDYTVFPSLHWAEMCSKDPIGRLSREFKRRTEVVPIFPDPTTSFGSSARSWSRKRRTRRRRRRYMTEATFAPLIDDHGDRLPSLPAALATDAHGYTSSPGATTRAGEGSDFAVCRRSIPHRSARVGTEG